MKLTSRVISLIAVGGSITTAVVGASMMSIRGNTKSAQKLLTFSRRLDDQQNYGNNNNNQYNNQYNNNGGNNYNGGYNNNGGQNQNQNYQNNDGGGYGGGYGDQGDDGNEESLTFLNNYSIKLLSCIQGEQIANYYEDGESEPSTVIFRLCPSTTCDQNWELGCDSGYGDYAVGITTFLAAYRESTQEDNNDDDQSSSSSSSSLLVYNSYGQAFDASNYMECAAYEVEENKNDNQDDDAQNDDQYNNNNNNNGQNQNQNQQYNNYQGGYGNNNQDDAHNDDQNDDQNNNNNNGQNQNQNQNQQNNNYQGGYGNTWNGNYNNGQRQRQRRQEDNNNNDDYYQDVQIYIGPGCSADGTTIGLKLFKDDTCSYANNFNFADLVSGWDGLPFSNGGLISMNCVTCSDDDDDDDDNDALSALCTDTYSASVSRCETNMTSYSDYGQDNNGCNYVESLVQAVYGRRKDDYYYEGASETTSFLDFLGDTNDARMFLACLLIFCLTAVGTAALVRSLFYRAAQAKKKRAAHEAAASPGKLLEDEE